MLVGFHLDSGSLNSGHFMWYQSSPRKGTELRAMNT